MPHGGAEEGALAAVADGGRVKIGVQVCFQRMMRRHLVALTAFFMESDPPALTLGVVVVDAQLHHGPNASEGEGHDANQGPIAQPDHGRGVDTVEQGAGLVGCEHGCLAALDDESREMLGVTSKLR
jgi:hypothetical protein